MKQIGLTLLATIAVSALAAAGADAQTKPPIKIGMLMTLSGPGAAANLPTRLGIDMALQEFNAAGGIGGRRIILVQGDDQANPTTGVDEAKRLVYQEKIE